MNFLRTLSVACTLTVSIYAVLLTAYFLAGFEFFPLIMFSPLGILSVFLLAFTDFIFITES